MKNSAKKVLYGIFVTVLSVTALIGAWAAGFVAMTGNNGWNIAAVCVLILLAAMAIGNTVAASVKRKRLLKMSAQEIVDKGMEYKSIVESDCEAAERRVKRKILLGNIWAVACIVLFLFVAFALGKGSVFGTSEDSVAGYIVVIVVEYFFVAGFFEVFFMPVQRAETERKSALSRTEYPLIYTVIERAAAAMGYQKRIGIEFSSEGFSIAEKGGGVSVFIDAELLALLTRDEFYSIMLHEFAHVKNEDTASAARLWKRKEKWSPEETGKTGFFEITGFLVRTFFLSLFAGEIEKEYTLWHDLSSRLREIRADGQVEETGMGKNYVNATAKSTLLNFYRELPVPEFPAEVWAESTPPEDYYARHLFYFEKYLERNEKLWNYILRHELPARIDSHPTFRMRMENMGLNSYDYSLRETDEAFISEQKKALDVVNKLTKELISQNYAERRSAYLKNSDRINEYRKADEAGRELSAVELIDYAGLSFERGEEEALSVAERLEEKMPGAPLALYYKGALLVRRGDETGVPLLYSAAQARQPLAEDAIGFIGKFALRMGRQDLLDEYRSRSVKFFQSELDYAADVRRSRNCRFVSADVPAERKASAIKDILLSGRGKVAEAIAATKRSTDGKDMLFCILRLDASIKSEEGYEIMDSVYHYFLCAELTKNGRFIFIDFFSARKEAEKIKKSVPDCVWYIKK